MDRRLLGVVKHSPSFLVRVSYWRTESVPPSRFTSCQREDLLASERLYLLARIP